MHFFWLYVSIVGVGCVLEEMNGYVYLKHEHFSISLIPTKSPLILVTFSACIQIFCINNNLRVFVAYMLAYH